MMFERRPWGWFLKLFHVDKLWIKILRVHGRTSLQSHDYRTEFHLGFNPTLMYRIVRPDEEHRMTAGWYLEIAWGHCNERDITRFRDDYGRA